MPLVAMPILLVEDTGPVVKIYRHYLKQMGIRHVDSAPNGLEAIRMLQARRYAAIISDWHMQPVSGFQLLQMVRADAVYADVPFIMATIEGRQDYIDAAEAAGVTDYMLKPFNAATLRTVLANASPAIGAMMEPPIQGRSWRGAGDFHHAEVPHPAMVAPCDEGPLREPFGGPL